MRTDITYKRDRKKPEYRALHEALRRELRKRRWWVE
jgi:hypothetical protein